jgi:hypothetical protein
MKLYLSGPMSGHPNLNFPAFWRAACTLDKKGYTVYSPAEHDWDRGWVRVVDTAGHDILQSNPAYYTDALEDLVVQTTDDFDEVVALREDVAVLATCDAVVVLPGWRRSRGASIEVRVAKMLQIPIMEYVDGGLRPTDSGVTYTTPPVFSLPVCTKKDVDDVLGGAECGS